MCISESDDEQVKSVFLQPNMAQEQKKEFFATTKPMPNAPAPPKPKDDNSYYADAPAAAQKLAGTAVKFDPNDYFAPPKKQ